MINSNLEKSTLHVAPQALDRSSIDSSHSHVMHDISFFEDVPLSGAGSRSRSSTMHSTLSRTMSDPINKKHRVSYSPDMNEKHTTTVTINVHSSSASPTPSRSSWEGHSTGSSSGAPPPYYSPPYRKGDFNPYGTNNKDLLDTFEDPLHPRHSKRKLIIAMVLALILLVILPLAIFVAVRKHEIKDNRRMNCVQVPGMFVNGIWKQGNEKCS